jgi:hypothetical protein
MVNSFVVEKSGSEPSVGRNREIDLRNGRTTPVTLRLPTGAERHLKTVFFRADDLYWCKRLLRTTSSWYASPSLLASELRTVAGNAGLERPPCVGLKRPRLLRGQHSGSRTLILCVSIELKVAIFPSLGGKLTGAGGKFTGEKGADFTAGASRPQSQVGRHYKLNGKLPKSPFPYNSTVGVSSGVIHRIGQETFASLPG